jgi:hypothetical protein
MRARPWPALVVVVGLISGAGVMLGGVVLVLTDRIDAVTAAMIGGLALVLVELLVAASERLEVVPVLGGTWIERAMVVGASVVAALGVALVVGPGGRPSSVSVLVGAAGVLAFIGLVGVQAFRAPGGRSASAGKVFDS